MNPDTQTAMIYDANKKSLVVAYLLWWFLGIFGAHRFYIGSIGGAVGLLVLTLLSIITSIILIGFVGLFAAFIWWLIDACLLPGMVRNANLTLIARLNAPAHAGYAYQGA